MRGACTFRTAEKIMLGARRSLLSGHKAPVVSIETSNEDSLLVSSSEDGSARFWDIREKHTSVKLFKLPQTDGEIGLCRRKDNLVAVSSGNCLFGYDLRVSTSIIVSTVALSYSSSDLDDEINDFCIGAESVIIPLDSGNVSTLSLSSFQQISSTRCHSNIASVVRCLPTGRNLVSGGYDCNLSTVKTEPILKLDQQIPVSSLMIPMEECDDTSQSINPPFVTGLELNSSSDKVAVGSGDGSVIVADLKKGGSRIDTRRSAWGGSGIHSVAVADIAWSGDTVWSVGNDSVLINMSESHINVRYKLGFKPNAVAHIGGGKVAVAGLQNEIELLDFS